MRICKFVSIVMIIVFAAALGLSAATVKATATIVEVTGKVQVSYVSGVWIPAKVGLKLQENDMIRTTEKSSAKIQLGDKTFTSISENTEMRMDKLNSEVLTESSVGKKTETQVKNINLKVLKGTAFAKVKKLNDKSTFNVSTPSAVCGVRGTSLEVEHQDETKISVLEGNVEVVNPDFPDQVISVSGRQQTSVSKNSSPKRAESVSADKLAQLENSAQVLEKIIEVIIPEPEFIDQSYKLAKKADDGNEYEYSVKVKNIDKEKAKIYLVLINSKGEETDAVQMKFSQGGKNFEDIKTYAVVYKFKQSGQFSHRYKVLTE